MGRRGIQRSSMVWPRVVWGPAAARVLRVSTEGDGSTVLLCQPGTVGGGARTGRAAEGDWCAETSRYALSVANEVSVLVFLWWLVVVLDEQSADYEERETYDDEDAAHGERYMVAAGQENADRGNKDRRDQGREGQVFVSR